MFERITFDPEIMDGRACIRGMRTPVSAVVGQIAHGASVEDVLAGYPGLDEVDVRLYVATKKIFPSVPRDSNFTAVNGQPSADRRAGR